MLTGNIIMADLGRNSVALNIFLSITLGLVYDPPCDRISHVRARAYVCVFVCLFFCLDVCMFVYGYLCVYLYNHARV